MKLHHRWQHVFLSCAITAGLAGMAIPVVAASDKPGALAPADTARPLFRWWWPGAMVKHGEIERELDAVARAGFGGVEIVSLPHQLKLDPRRYGWGSPAWNEAIRHTLAEAHKRRLQVDLTIGPAWPSVVPGLSPDGEAASKELAVGRVVLNSGQFSGSLPVPEAGAANVKTRQLVAVMAFPCGPDCGADDTASVAPAAAVDLRHAVRGERIEWDVPAGRWLLAAFWQRGTGQMDNMRVIEGPTAPNLTDPPAYVVDHFSTAGARAVTDYWDKHLLPSGTLALLRQVGASIFEDSLELGGDPHWTPALLDEFRRRRGYALDAYLPALFAEKPKAGPAASGPEGNVGLPEFMGKPKRYAFRVPQDLRARVMHDFSQTLSELYIEKRVATIKAWANGHGLKYRNQGYGAPVDTTAAAAATDIPEGESLGFGNRTDSFRLIAGGRDMAGLTLLTDECCADFEAGYAMTWKKMLSTIHDNFSGGVNRIVVHGLAYADDDVPAATWPGWAPMVPFPPLGTGFAEAWGPRIPTWDHLRPIADYLTRSQRVLQRGRAITDIAIYRFSHAVDGSFLHDPALVRAGYSYQYVSPALFDAPSAVVSGGRLAPDGPAYKALVIDGAAAIPVRAMRRVADFASAGLTVLIVGSLPGTVPGMVQAGDEENLRIQTARLLGLPTVHRVASQAELLAALRKLKLRPDSEPAAASGLLAIQRQEGSTRHYWLYNPGSDPIDQEYSFAGTGVPELLNAWNGTSSQLAAYRQADGRTSTRLRLPPGGTTILSLAPGKAEAHVQASNADMVLRRDGALQIRSAFSGTYRTVLDDGRAVLTDVGALPTPLDLTHARWTLEVEDWHPEPGRSGTPTAIRKTARRLVLDGLKPWPAIAGLQDVSGKGVYTITFPLTEPLAGGQGYYLDLGTVFDTVMVSVNGVDLSVDQVARRVDLGAVLRKGSNVIRIEVATTLLNRMRATMPNMFARRPRQEYGLIGPVRLIPYRDTVIARGRQ